MRSLIRRFFNDSLDSGEVTERGLQRDTRKNRSERAALAVWGPFGAREAKTATAPGDRQFAKSIELHLLGRMARGGIEPPTRGFSVRCSTN